MAARSAGQWRCRFWRVVEGAAYRPAQRRLRVRVRSRRAPDGEGEKKLRSQSPARMERHNATGHRPKRYTAEACGFDHPRKYLRLGKFADRFDEILIGVAISGHNLAHTRDHLEGIEFIQG